jgi:hypothetical protein
MNGNTSRTMPKGRAEAEILESLHLSRSRSVTRPPIPLIRLDFSQNRTGSREDIFESLSTGKGRNRVLRNGNQV